MAQKWINFFFTSFLEPIKGGSLSIPLPVGQASQESNLPKAKNYLSWNWGNSSHIKVQPSLKVELLLNTNHSLKGINLIEWFSYDFKMRMPEQNRNNKWMEIERFDSFIEQVKRTWLLVGWANARVKKLHAQELFRKQSILCFEIMLQHDWPIEQFLLHIRVFFGRKMKSPCFNLFIHWLIKQITNTYRNYFSRSYDNRW